jgi:anhydro-N-acetylmuramic acid kinase
MNTLQPLASKEKKLVMGLMSGTCCDGVDASLVTIEGKGLGTKVVELGFVSIPYEKAFRKRLLELAKGDEGGSRELCLVNFRLGQLFVQAAKAVCKKAGVTSKEVDLIGSHGHTLYHIPESQDYFGKSFTATLQLGEASLLRESFNCPVVSDFRVRDMAAGGQGAPLVPYTEYLLYGSASETVALQNIGGIGNLTVIPRKARPEQILAFDTGPGNMVIDELVFRYSHGNETYDNNGDWGRKGQVSKDLVKWMLDNDDYLNRFPPKTTGRERYGRPFVDLVEQKGDSLSLSPFDVIASATYYTAFCISYSLDHFCPVKIDRLIVGGGGIHNSFLMEALGGLLEDIKLNTQEDLGFNSDSKEAVAFALLANETVAGRENTLIGATGASHTVVMGKILL